MHISTPLSGELAQYLDLSSAELKLTAQNMANLDTPGYRTLGFDFAAEMGRAAAEAGWGRRGGWKEIGPATPKAGEVDGLLERPDGNNVSMDREGLLLAETQMQFGLGVQLLHHEFQNLLMAINEGSKS